ncbi:MAG: hypothetical protein CM1200mP34_2370 [Verrucomicrobiales bacterium]|nr:MAG: hypothetical protein CM1200mP34_2370 [Verrucomicrobiales bacterium]
MKKAFAPVDLHPGAPADEWSGDLGCGAQYFSQQAVGRLFSRLRHRIDTSLKFPGAVEDRARGLWNRATGVR